MESSVHLTYHLNKGNLVTLVNNDCFTNKQNNVLLKVVMDKCIQTSPHLSSDEDFSVK